MVTPGEPAGIGPDLCIQMAQSPLPCHITLVTDPQLITQRAQQLGLPIQLDTHGQNTANRGGDCGKLHILPTPLLAPVESGKLNPKNAEFVLNTLKMATHACLHGEFDGLVTGPIHKGIINQAGIPFTGHTEFLAAQCNTTDVVMMLIAPGIRVALASTHLPLSAVSAAITAEKLRRTIEILHSDLRGKFKIRDPVILVCGLNPHAGEDGHLGREEIEIISPVVTALREQGLNLLGPLPADTVFIPSRLKTVDAVLAMYHDQGLPVLKHIGFGGAVNVTLGLPLVRTSVDHGTALDLAGTGKAEIRSFQAAITTALEML